MISKHHQGMRRARARVPEPLSGFRLSSNQQSNFFSLSFYEKIFFIRLVHRVHLLLQLLHHAFEPPIACFLNTYCCQVFQQRFSCGTSGWWWRQPLPLLLHSGQLTILPLPSLCFLAKAWNPCQACLTKAMTTRNARHRALHDLHAGQTCECRLACLFRSNQF